MAEHGSFDMPLCGYVRSSLLKTFFSFSIATAAASWALSTGRIEDLPFERPPLHWNALFSGIFISFSREHPQSRER
jgi:hypothetical protein